MRTKFIIYFTLTLLFVQVWLGWKAITVISANELAIIKIAKGDTIILDFGRNMVGLLNGIISSTANPIKTI